VDQGHVTDVGPRMTSTESQTSGGGTATAWWSTYVNGGTQPDGTIAPPRDTSFAGNKSHPQIKGAKHSGAGGHSQSALDILTNWFEQNLQLGNSAEIVKIIHDAWVKGYSPADIDLFLPDIEKTHAFQTRFPGYMTAVKNGYLPSGVGGLAQYIQLEGSYRAKVQAAGLPAGFYDDHSDFGQFIERGISPDEIENRIGMAVREAQQIDPTMRNLMAKFYGLSTGDVASYFLDPKRALPVIERQYQTAGVASWASKYGLDVNSMTRYEDLVDKGVTEDQAAQGYGTVKALKDYLGKTAGIYGETFNQSDAENDAFFNNSTKRRKIIANEEATFGGSSQGATGSAKRTSY